MARVLKRGKPPKDQFYHHTCGGCESKIEYSSKDRVSCQREGEYASCPVCKNFIDWKEIIKEGPLTFRSDNEWAAEQE